jgi:cytochrome c553
MRIKAVVALLLVTPILASCSTSGWSESERQQVVDEQMQDDLESEKLSALSAQGDATAGAIAFDVCEGCHRHAGSGRPNGSYPRLAGQHASVLIKQIYDTRAGRRQNHKMLPFADEEVVSPKQIADIAAYLEVQAVTPDNGKGPGSDLARGQALYERDCARCHGAVGQGDGERTIPRLSGQHYLYLLREALAIREGQRGNANPEMAETIRSYTDAELEAVSDFASRLPSG